MLLLIVWNVHHSICALGWLADEIKKYDLNDDSNEPMTLTETETDNDNTVHDDITKVEI